MHDSQEVALPVSFFDPKAIEVAGRIFAAVRYKGKETALSLTPKQLIFLDKLFETAGNLPLAADAAGVTPTCASKWLKDLKIRAYIDERISAIRAKKGQSFEEWRSKIWEGFEGKVDLSSTQLKCADIIGKMMGVYTQKTVHESHSREEILFVQKSDSLESRSPRKAEISGRLSSAFYLPISGEAVGEIPVDPMEASTQMPDGELGDMVSSPPQDPSQGHSVEAAS